MKIAKYFVVGGFSALVDLAVFSAGVYLLGWGWFPAALLSFILATAVNYVLSVGYVFGSGARFGRHSEIVLVAIASGIGLAGNQAMLWVGIRLLGLGPVPAKVLATASVFGWNYAARRYYIFRPHGRPGDKAKAEAGGS